MRPVSDNYEEDLEEALITLVRAIQEAELDHDLEAGQNGEGPVAQALLALGRPNIYELKDDYEEGENGC